MIYYYINTKIIPKQLYKLVDYFFLIEFFLDYRITIKTLLVTF